MSSQELQPSSMTATCGSSVTSDDELYIKNTLGEKFDVPECVKVLGVKWNPTDDDLVCDLSNLFATSFLKKNP